MTRGAVSELRVSHSSNRWLAYRALIVVTQQAVTLPSSTLPVTPKLEVIEQWTRGVRGLVLHGFAFRDPESPPPIRASRRERDPNGFNASVTFGFWGGERRSKLDGFNAALVREGFTPLSSTYVIGGLDLDFTFGRLRGGVSLGAGGRSSRHRATGRELSAWQSEVGFTAGFDVIRHDQLAVFLSSGILFGRLFVEPPEGSTLFPDLRPWQGRAVFSHTLWPLEAGTDYFVPLGRASATENWVLQFGTRIGWLEQLGGSWATEEETSSRGITGPAVDVSGLRARLVLGIGFQNGW